MIPDIEGKRFQHYKGNFYKVLSVAKHSETGALLVIYQAEYDGQVWARPLGMFLEALEDGTPRFRQVD